MSEFADTFLDHFEIDQAVVKKKVCPCVLIDSFMLTKIADAVSPISIIAVCGAGQVKLSKHKGQAVLGGEAAVYDTVRCCDRPVGSDQGGSTTSRVGPIS